MQAVFCDIVLGNLHLSSEYKLSWLQLVWRYGQMFKHLQILLTTTISDAHVASFRTSGTADKMTMETSAAECHVQDIDRLEPQAECQLYKYGICNIITLHAS